MFTKGQKLVIPGQTALQDEYVTFERYAEHDDLYDTNIYVTDAPKFIGASEGTWCIVQIKQSPQSVWKSLGGHCRIVEATRLRPESEFINEVIASKVKEGVFSVAEEKPLAPSVLNLPELIDYYHQQVSSTIEVIPTVDPTTFIVEQQFSLTPGVEYTAISLHQWWASLVRPEQEFKHVETRDWKIKPCRDLVIQAAKTDEELAFLMGVKAKIDNLDKYPGFRASGQHLRALDMLLPLYPTLKLPLGYALCVVDVVDCVETTSAKAQGLSAQEQAFGNYAPNRYAWILENIRLIKPFPLKGSQKFWKFTYQG